MTDVAENRSAIPFAAYKGSEKYIFISYAHRDSAVVYPILLKFTQQDYNVWYDEGIEPGIEWPEEIANALDKSSLFVVFITPNSVNSENVRNEINFALAKKLPFIAIHLSPATLTPGLQLQIGSKQAILRYQMDEDSFIRKYRYSFDSVLGIAQKDVPPPPPQIPVTAPKPQQQEQAPSPATPQPKPSAGAIAFKCDLIRRAACEKLGLPPSKALEEKHLLAITDLKLFADFFGEDLLARMKYKDHLMIYKKGSAPVVTYDRGNIKDLSDLAHFRNLKYLNLPFHQFSELSPLVNLPIEILDISCNLLADLTPLGDMQRLNHLELDFSSFNSLQPLQTINKLSYLSLSNISAETFSELCGLNLTTLSHLYIGDSKFESLAGISHLQGITYLEIKSCTIFEFEEIADLRNLQNLTMTGTRCFDYSFLKKLPNLQYLGIGEDQKPAIIECFGEKPPFLK